MKETPIFSVRRGLEAIVRYLYLEPLLPGKDALVVAAGDGAAARAFLGRLAVRSAEHAEPPERAPLPADMTALRGRADQRPGERRGLAFRDGAFDVVFVPEVAELPDPGLLFQEVTRVLQPHGLVLAATRNASCLSPIAVPPAGGRAEVWTYSRLRALLATYFPAVRMIGQSPFLGYTFVEYDPRAVPDVRLDTTLLEGRGEDPEFFIAVGARARDAALPLPALFQVPLQEFTVAEAPVDEPAAAPSETAALQALAVEEALAEARRECERLKADLAGRNVAIARLEQEVRRAENEAAEAREKTAKMAKAAEDERRSEQRKSFDATFARAAQLADISPPPPPRPTGPVAEEDDLVLRKLRDELEDKRREAEQLRRAAEEARGKLAEAERRATEAERRAAEAAELRRQLDETRTKLQAAEARARAAEQAVPAREAAERAMRTAVERCDAAERERALAVAAREAAEGEAHKAVDAVERRLVEQGRRVAELERLAEERRRLADDLVRELRHQTGEPAVPCVPDPVPPPEAPSPEDDSIAEAWATAVGEVDALRTAVAQLEGELTGARWRNAELQTAVAELLEETQDAEGEAERLRGALEIAQVAAEEATRELSERTGTLGALQAEVERLRPLSTQATDVARLVGELQRQAAELSALLRAREAELARLRQAQDSPGGAAEALAARLDVLRGTTETIRERLARLADDPRAGDLAGDLAAVAAALDAALRAAT
jgi:hypothetical protein